MRTFFAMILLSFSLVSFAEVTREDAVRMIDEMVAQNMISAEEALKAKVRLRKMNISEIERKVADRAPASVSVADDLSAEQFTAIQHDLKVIAPHSVKEEKQAEVQAVIIRPTEIQTAYVQP